MTDTLVHIPDNLALAAIHSPCSANVCYTKVRILPGNQGIPDFDAYV